jgi:tetratricopeptide (TPR) repeat protein
VAIRAAAERVWHDQTDVCSVANLLRPEESRLEWLERPGRLVGELIAAEYDRLLPEEQEALRLLTLVRSPTFLPWVLLPLLDLGPSQTAQAEALVDRLSAVHLLEDRGTDEVSGVARYGFHELVRRFAEAKTKGLPLDTREKAQRRLDEAYGEVAAAALTNLTKRRGGRDHPRTLQQWLLPGSSLPARIADRPEHWVRAEYANLLRVISAAYAAENYTLCWQVAARLDGCVPAGGGDLAVTLTRYSQAAEAAEADNNELGTIDVLLACGSFLSAVERYEEAVDFLRRAADRARLLQGGSDRATALAAMRREATAHRKIGEAYQQAAAYVPAAAALAEAGSRVAAALELVDRRPRTEVLPADRATEAETRDEQQLIQLLVAEVHQVDSPERLYDRLVDGSLTDSTDYRLRLALAEAARRRGDWQNTIDHLGEASGSAAGDLRREATVHYRLARTYLGRGLSGQPRDSHQDAGRDATIAIRHAATAVVTFQRMRNDAGVVRARCLLAGALRTREGIT